MTGSMTATKTAALPPTLAANPRLSGWLKFSRDGFVQLSPGKVEIGQGIVTALAQIAADELDVDIARIRMVATGTPTSPNEGTTSGSLSVEQSGTSVRYAAAQARSIYLSAAAQRLGVAPESLSVEDGTIVGPGNLRTSYWELADDSLLARDATPGIAAKAPGARRLAGTPAARLDLPDKVFGRPRFIHQLALAGHAARARAEAARPWAPSSRRSMRSQRARCRACIAVVRDGNFIGVVAETEAAAEAGLAALRKGAAWDAGAGLPDETKLSAWLKSQPVETTTVDERKASTPAASRQHHPPAILAALHRARVDGALLRHRAVDGGRQGAHLVALPGRLQSARRPDAGAEAAGGEHHRSARRGRRLLRPQRRRRCRLRCCAAGACREWASRASAMVARGRARLVADGRRHGGRPRGQPRCARRDRRLARRGVEQRSCLARRPCADPDRARGLAAGASRSSASSPSIRRWQTAAGRSATWFRPTISRPGASSATGCS